MADLQLIDYAGNFSAELQQYVSSIKGDYFTVSILGPQSSGKSTLLNAIFNTNFPVLQPVGGRTQTTKGIHLSKTQPPVQVLVQDVEGSDSRERIASSAESMESKFALFAFATSNVLIMNMWYHDIGRREAENLTLLATVFEAYVKLFHAEDREIPKVKPTILLVVRDAEEDVQPEALKATLVREVAGVWDATTKSGVFQSARLEQVFTVAFVALPHYRHRKADFDRQIADLRSQFFESNRGDYFFAEYEKTELPIKSLAERWSQVWETTRGSRELQVPSERELEAAYRCGEVVAARMAEAQRVLVRLKAQVANGNIVDNLAQQSKDILEEALNQYKSATAAYEGTASQMKKGEDLRANVLKELQLIYSQQVVNYRDTTFSKLKTTIHQVLPLQAGARATVSDADQKQLIDHGDAIFQKQCTEARLKEMDWGFDQERVELKSMIQEAVAERLRTLKSIPAPGQRVKPGWFLSPNVEFNCTFQLVTAINLGPKQTVGLPFDEQDTLVQPNSVFFGADGGPGLDLEKIDMSSETTKGRLVPFR
mmetsp:Transcript_31965/g.51629  ORF Transcript_31965/g.51629 Transcript_31965/m.51629 type:complete len:541 (+) Transcript_31965:53-1675(+)|eukprot:CAMPEP_0184644278 /NCGR_PEP_ID=MMETSP0308-20130426/1026_1 /TAXON_ID=38269 /ORGANISM="Gloeochaete witrockiana, Strain SAG 46.84" /LENGTH=540 /DNA_ID=CAMNT_0027072727 /DNA_START=24 /DNA_END=1646 /DNA_ORIENTATION=+